MGNFLVVIKNSVVLHSKLFPAFFTMILIFVACGRPDKGTPYKPVAEERTWMEKFFNDVMLDAGAIYTLWGSKPLTTIAINYYSDEEVEEYYQQMSDEEKKNAVISEVEYDLPNNWEKWEKVRSKFPLTHYLFYKQEDQEDPKFADIYFVNIANTVQLLQKHYSLFSEATGGDFDPEQVVIEMESPSVFWERVKNNSVLLGLLFGFGYENASSFHDKYGEAKQSCSESCSSDTPTYGEVSIEKFSLPIFASFAKGRDAVIEK